VGNTGKSMALPEMFLTGQRLSNASSALWQSASGMLQNI
jgi:hypothetical protein